MKVQNTAEAARFASALAHNKSVRSAAVNEASFPHYEVTSIITGDFTTPTPSSLSIANTGTADLDAVILLAEACRSALLVHFADANPAPHVLAGAHDAVDEDNLADISTDEVPTADDQDSVNALLNALKVALIAHEADTDLHILADATNTISAADATDLASSKLLAADIRAIANAHIAFADEVMTLDYT